MKETEINIEFTQMFTTMPCCISTKSTEESIMWQRRLHNFSKLVEIQNIAVFVCAVLRIRPKNEIRLHFGRSCICKNGLFLAGAEICTALAGSWSRGHGFDLQLFHFHLTTLDRLLTHVPLSAGMPLTNSGAARIRRALIPGQRL